MEPRPTAVKVPSPNHWTAREFPVTTFWENVGWLPAFYQNWVIESFECFSPISFVIVPFKIKKRQPLICYCPPLGQYSETEQQEALLPWRKPHFHHLDLDTIRTVPLCYWQIDEETRSLSLPFTAKSQALKSGGLEFLFCLLCFLADDPEHSSVLWQSECGLQKNFQVQSIAERNEFIWTKSRDNVGAVNTAGQPPDRPGRVDRSC